MLDTILKFLPQVQGPTERKLGLGIKFKWTLIILLLYFILKSIPLYGLGPQSTSQFEALQVILAADFGSLISLGIGPIVTASIILQLLNGSGILKFNTTTAEGKARFQGVQKLLAVVFIIVEAFIYVFMGGLAPADSLRGTGYFLLMELVLVFQLILGGFLILLMDDVISKWGFGSGISLFIAAGVSESLFVQTFSWFRLAGDTTGYPVGAIPTIFAALAQGDISQIVLKVGAIIATVAVFGLVVWFQSMKVEIPLSFGRVRGYGMRWPLNFLYTSNIPVILIAALLANVQLFSTLIQSRFNIDTTGFAAWFTAPDLIPQILTSGFDLNITIYLRALFYTVVLIGGSVVFAWFWMQSAGMDPHSQAKQIMASGLQVPGFRKDPRIIEHILRRYIGPLTIMGGIAVGVLAALADISGALTSGTGLLLAVMIIYRLYEDVAKQHMMDMNPMMQKFMGKK